MSTALLAFDAELYDDLSDAVLRHIASFIQFRKSHGAVAIRNKIKSTETILSQSHVPCIYTVFTVNGPTVRCVSPHTNRAQSRSTKDHTAASEFRRRERQRRARSNDRTTVRFHQWHGVPARSSCSLSANVDVRLRCAGVWYSFVHVTPSFESGKLSSSVSAATAADRVV